MKRYDFKNDLAYGQLGEYNTKRMLENRGWQVQWLKNDCLPYDLIACKEDRKERIEVKRQSNIHTRNAFCLEQRCNFSDSENGWWFKYIDNYFKRNQIDCDYICFNDKNDYYLVKLPELIAYFVHAASNDNLSAYHIFDYETPAEHLYFVDIPEYSRNNWCQHIYYDQCKF